MSAPVSGVVAATSSDPPARPSSRPPSRTSVGPPPTPVTDTQHQPPPRPASRNSTASLTPQQQPVHTPHLEQIPADIKSTTLVVAEAEAARVQAERVAHVLAQQSSIRPTASAPVVTESSTTTTTDVPKVSLPVPPHTTAAPSLMEEQENGETVDYTYIASPSRAEAMTSPLPRSDLATQGTQTAQGGRTSALSGLSVPSPTPLTSGTQTHRPVIAPSPSKSITTASVVSGSATTPLSAELSVRKQELMNSMQSASKAKASPVKSRPAMELGVAVSTKEGPPAPSEQVDSSVTEPSVSVKLQRSNVFIAGEMIHGSVDVVIPRGLGASEVGVHLLGEETVVVEDSTYSPSGAYGYSNENKAPNTASNTCCNVPVILFQSEHKAYFLPAGKHKLRFTLLLNQALPRSCEFDNGFIRYKINASARIRDTLSDDDNQFDQESPRRNTNDRLITDSQTITVLETTESTRDAAERIPKKVINGGLPNFIVSAGYDRKFYYVGDSARLNLDIANQMDSTVESVSVQLQRHVISMACSTASLVDEFAYDKTQVAPGSRLRTLLSVPLNVPFPCVTHSNFVEIRYVIDIVCHIMGDSEVHVPGPVLIFDSPITYSNRTVQDGIVQQPMPLLRRAGPLGLFSPHKPQGSPRTQQQQQQQTTQQHAQSPQASGPYSQSFQQSPRIGDGPDSPTVHDVAVLRSIPASIQQSLAVAPPSPLATPVASRIMASSTPLAQSQYQQSQFSPVPVSQQMQQQVAREIVAQPPPIREVPAGNRRQVSDLEFEQLLRTLKYTPNPIEDAGGKQWSTDDLRRLHDAVIDNADRRRTVMRSGISAALSALDPTDLPASEAALKLLALLTTEDGAEDVLLQLGGILRVPAALQMDDKNIIKHAVRTLRNITVSEACVHALLGSNVSLWIVSTAQKLIAVPTIVCDAAKIFRNFGLIPEGRQEIVQSDAVRLLAQCVASNDDETVRHALRALSLIASDGATAAILDERPTVATNVVRWLDRTSVQLELQADEPRPLSPSREGDPRTYVREMLRSAAGILATIRLNGSASTSVAARSLLRTVRFAGEQVVAMLAARALSHVVATDDAVCKDLLAANGVATLLGIIQVAQDHHLQKCLLTALELLSLRVDGAKQLKSLQEPAMQVLLPKQQSPHDEVRQSANHLAQFLYVYDP